MSFPAYPFIEMVASFISRNLCRPYLYQTHVGLAVVRESADGKCRHNLNQVALAGCTRQDNSGRNYFVELVQVFVDLVQVFVQQRAWLHTDFF